MEKYIKWGVIIVLVYLAFRWLTGALQGGLANGALSSGSYPYGYYTGLAGSGMYPVTVWGPRNVYRGGRGHRR